MEFSNLKIRNIESTVRFTPNVKNFSSKNKNSHIIGIQLTGSAEHFLGNRKFTLSENCLYFFNQKEDYDVEVIEKGNAFSVNFTTYEDIDTPSFFVQIRNNSEVLALLERIETSYTSESRLLDAFSDFYKLCSIINRQYNKTYTKTDDRLFRAREYIETNFRDKTCLSDAAKLCNISRRRLNDIFKAQFLITPNNYLIKVKISYAKRLLPLNYIPIETVAKDSGFDDVYYFSKVFKKETGKTPAEYRKTAFSDKNK